MRFHQILLFLLGFVTTINALTVPLAFSSFSSSTNDLFKRKGGGGGGGKGGGGGSSGSGGGGKGGKGGTSGGSGGSSGGRGGGSTGGGSTGGGSSPSGSRGQTPKTYGGSNGGTFYGGGATQPYRAGGRSTGGLPVGPLIAGGALGALFAGPWIYAAYQYHYPNKYTYHNDTSNQNMTLPIECLCEKYAACGCDANNNTDYINAIANNQTVARVANLNGTQTLVINGTLPNTTDANGETSSTGSTSNSNTGAASPGPRGLLLETSGWWVVLGGVVYTMWFI